MGGWEFAKAMVDMSQWLQSTGRRLNNLCCPIGASTPLTPIGRRAVVNIKSGDVPVWSSDDVTFPLILEANLSAVLKSS